MVEQFSVAFIHGAGSERKGAHGEGLTSQQRAERREQHRQPIINGIGKIGLAEWEAEAIPPSAASGGDGKDSKDGKDGQIVMLEYVAAPTGRGVRKLRKYPAAAERNKRLPDKEIMCECCGQREFIDRVKGSGFFARLKDIDIVHNGADAARNLSINPGGLHEVWEYLGMKNRREGVLASLANQLPSDPFVLWGHSLGSVIALELATYLEKRDEPLVLVTSGSPLNLRRVRNNLLSGVQDWAENCREIPWINVYDGYDVINPNKHGLRHVGYGPIIDLKVRNGANYHWGVKYLEHKAPWEEVYKIISH